jgi:hypothetical protein
VWLFAAFLLLAETAPLGAVPRNLPDESDAVDAYFEWEVATCRALIDVCETGVLPLSKDGIKNLSCRSSQSGRAKCSFRTPGSKCSARFVSNIRKADHARSVRWSNMAPDADNGWAVSWTDRIGKGPEVKCKGVD